MTTARATTAASCAAARYARGDGGARAREDARTRGGRREVMYARRKMTTKTRAFTTLCAVDRSGRTRAAASANVVDYAPATTVGVNRQFETSTTNRRRQIMPVRLLTGYSEVINTLCDELRRTSAGDEVEFSVYVFESGKSSQRVIDAMVRAVNRGVHVRCSIDGSPVSKFTRWCEGSTTLTSELEGLQTKLGRERFSFEAVRQPTHAKFMVIHRKYSLPTAIFGGVNIGDRIANWRDFAIRAEGHEVVQAMRSSLFKADTSGSADVRDTGIRFITNLPTGFCPLAWTFPRYKNFPGTFNIKPTMMKLLEDASYSRYRIAMAYMDAVGADMLDAMLARGNTSLTLVVPRNPNVYHDANRKALKRLIHKNADRRNGDSSNLKIVMLDDMLHAKVFFAESDDGAVPDVAMLGSCNLKQRSLGQFVELNAEIQQPILTRALRAKLDDIINESLPICDDDLLYAEPKATVEEWLG